MEFYAPSGTVHGCRLLVLMASTSTLCLKKSKSCTISMTSLHKIAIFWVIKSQHLLTVLDRNFVYFPDDYF